MRWLFWGTAWTMKILRNVIQTRGAVVEGDGAGLGICCIITLLLMHCFQAMLYFPAACFELNRALRCSAHWEMD